MEIGIKINWCRSSISEREFPAVVLSADTDMVTDGLVCLTSIEKLEAVVAELTTDEYNAGREGMIRCEDRINGELGRMDLRITYIARVVENVRSSKGLSFKEFIRSYNPPTLFYRDIFDPTGEAMVVREENENAFVAAGGKILKLINIKNIPWWKKLFKKS